MEYNPEKYWQDRGEDYRVSFDTSKELLNLSTLIKIYRHPHDQFLDIGSGYGRLYQYLTKDNLILESRYWMIDFVRSMIEKCHLQTGKRPQWWDGKKLPFTDNGFDWIISFSVFLHVPPEDLHDVFKEHVRVCKKYMFIATYTGNDERLAKHCFRHDYETLFDMFDLDIRDSKTYTDKRTNWLLAKRG